MSKILRSLCSLSFIMFLTSGGSSAAVRLKAKILHPLAHNAYLGQPDQEVFECLLWGEEFIDWIINGERLHHTPRITDSMGIIPNNSRETNPSRSGLIIPATAINSYGIDVQCVAVSIPISKFVVSNETGHFRIQGLLNMSESSIMTASYNLSHNKVSWERPFSLEITTTEPDIYGYTVCTVTDFVFPEECTNVTNNSFIIAKYSVNILVRIAANNIVGKSNQVEHLVNPCFNVLATAAELKIPAVVSFNGNLTEITFTLSILQAGNISEICLHKFNVNIYDHKSPSTSLFSTHSLFAYNVLMVQYELQTNTEYTAVIEDVRTGNQSNFHNVSFHTYHIQYVIVEVLNDDLEISCQFARGTSALGCIVDLQFTNGTKISRNVSLTCKQEQNQVQCSATISFEISTVGNFSVSVYSWEANSQISTHRVFYREFDSNITEVLKVNNSNVPRQIITITVGIIGGVTVALIITILTVMVVYAKVSNSHKQDHVSQTSVMSSSLTHNEAYGQVLQLQMNAAYGNVKSIHCHVSNVEPGPHIYDEITQTQVQSESCVEPEYTEITDSTPQTSVH